MSNIKNTLLEKINKKAKHYKSLKDKIATSEISPESVVFEFFANMEDAYFTLSSIEELQTHVTLTSNLMDEKMKLFDPYVKLELMWDKEVTLPRVYAVLIKWSTYYLNQNPGKPPENLVDYAQLLLSNL